METKKHLPHKRPQVALVLSSGGVNGFAHLGVLDTLQKADIPIDLIVGCSIGAAIGALYAQDPHPEKIFQQLSALWPAHYSYEDLGLPRLQEGIHGHGFFTLEGIKDHLKALLHITHFEKLQIPLQVVTTQLETGKLHVFSKGPLLDPICASMAIPGFFQPLQIDGAHYVDGGILAELPVHIAQASHPHMILLSDVSIQFQETAPKSDLGNVWFKLWGILQRHNKASQGAKADHVLYPAKDHPPRLWASQETLQDLYHQGQKVAEAHLPAIRKTLAQRPISP